MGFENGRRYGRFSPESCQSTRGVEDLKPALQLCYGQIGISAVAAAVRYQGDAKNPAYTPVAMKTDDRGTTVA